MPTDFDMIITADSGARSAELRLLDAGGNQLAYRRTDFGQLSVSRKRGVFDLRNHLRYNVAEGQEAASVAEIGVCIAEAVLGPEIFHLLWQSASERTLRIQLPGAADGENVLAAALARVPWEIARPSPQEKTLGERNLLVRVVHEMTASASRPLPLAGDEPLRVLFVLAETRGSRPLDARRERRALLQLFEKDIYPHRRVVAHVLSHGVTRQRLEAQIADHGGYHIVHWSGHGHLNLLELARPGGAKDHISGEELADLFVRAGGLLPHLFFLGACHSGDILRVNDWDDFLAVARGVEPNVRGVEPRDVELAEPPGFTGTAYALLRSGVPSVIAMRYAVGDDYARGLALEFYRRLLADPQPKTVAAALTMARKALLDDRKHDLARFIASDHATPVLYGEAQPELSPPKGRSPALNPRDPRRPKIGELTTAAHEHFVGRTWELAGLGTDFIGASRDMDVKPVAVITGLGGMGKTALVAEALALWMARFDWVLLFQAKPSPLGFETTLRDIDLRLRGELGHYYRHVQERPADAIHRDATPEFKGPERLEWLTRNLIRALQDEAILLVLDNFETNLKPQAEPPIAGESPGWACQDPAWDRCLARLAEELLGSSSRVLITCRSPLAALATAASHPVPLGPLPPGEAALFLKKHPGLAPMVLGSDAEEKKLARRLLNASRFHPLLMDRLARLASAPALRSQLLEALETLETTKNYAKLPDLFTTGSDGASERGYLDDALTTSIDFLIQGANPDARRLLWMVAIGNHPLAPNLLYKMWSPEGHDLHQLRELKQRLDMSSQLSPEIQEQLREIPANLRARANDLPPEPPPWPDLAQVLRHLVAIGLVTEERTQPDDEPDCTCHELVRERIHAWMGQHPQDRGELTEHGIRLEYAGWLEAAFTDLQHEDMTLALQAGRRALVYCVQAGAYERLGNFAGVIITAFANPRLLDELLPHLHSAAESAPEGEPRWSCLLCLADALRMSGNPEGSLSHYEQAAHQARVLTESGGDDVKHAWTGLAIVTSHWANALLAVGKLDAARQKHLEAAEAHTNAGNPAIAILSSELEILRIDIKQDQAPSALPEVTSLLSKLESWWRLHQSGQNVPEAPDLEDLARTIIGALNIASHAHLAQDDPESALPYMESILAFQRSLKRPEEDIGRSRMDRAMVLSLLGRQYEAQHEFEACLNIFQDDPLGSSGVRTALASLFDDQGDVQQAIQQERRALALCELLADPAHRAISHHNLANYLGKSSAPGDSVESARHRLADLLYCIVAGLTQSLKTSMHNLLCFGYGHDNGQSLILPRVSELLAAPAFHGSSGNRVAPKLAEETPSRV